MNEEVKEEPKQKSHIAVFIVFATILIGIVWYWSTSFPVELNVNQTYYFYSDACSNCQVVKLYMEENNVEDKFDIIKIDAAKQSNRASFNGALTGCKIPYSSGGVPLLYINDVCYIGRVDVIDYLNASILEIS